ncbi:hypothetical protein NG755_09270 [Aliarcobacter cryaerophilus]|uniref:hypothetical protein n=1 Tax=Aliarcobacter cryaerophilus TaxID=28198 RepID=UPI003DA1F14A
MNNDLWNQLGTYFGSLVVLTGGIVWLGKYIFNNSAKALLEKYKNELKIHLEKEKIEIIKEKENFDRKLEEIKKWTNPILSSVNGVTGRLKHIIEQEGYLELDKEHEGYEYYYLSTLYYFAQYLCWIQILKEEINYEIFDENKKETPFFKAIKDVNIEIREYDKNIDFNKRGNPIYSLQQREIAELMKNESGMCIGYYEFNNRLSNDNSFKKILRPINNLICEIKPNSKEFERLKNILEKIILLKKECQNILKGK